MPNLSTGATVFLVIETGFFLYLVFAMLQAHKKLSPILGQLFKSLRLSEDLFGDERSFVTSARTRYRRAAERIEDVDAHAIALGELSGYEITRIAKWRISIGALNELMGSAPGVFVTIGLLGTFIGLALNLGQLSLILDSGNGSSASPGDLVEKLGGVLAPMSTAFISSLGGVFFSLLFWITSLIVGANRLLGDSETLLTAYLEQVIQADCNRFSLVRASVERMELCLAEFMANFGERVGQAIDTAMSKKVSEVFDSIKTGSDALVSYASTLDSGVKEIAISGKTFYKASQIFSETTFATDFGETVKTFLEASSGLSKQADQLSADMEKLVTRSELIEKGWDQVRDSIKDSGNMASNLLTSTTEYTNAMVVALGELNDASKQLRSARLSIGKDNKQSDELSRALLNELEASQPSREEIARLLQTLSSQLQNRVSTDARLATLVDNSLKIEGLTSSERSKLNILLDSLIKA